MFAPLYPRRSHLIDTPLPSTVLTPSPSLLTPSHLGLSPSSPTPQLSLVHQGQRPGSSPRRQPTFRPLCPTQKGAVEGAFLTLGSVWCVKPHPTLERYWTLTQQKPPPPHPFGWGRGGGSAGRKYATHHDDPDATKAPSTSPIWVGQRGRKVGYLLVLAV